jgi:hypothetical protein
MVERKAQPPSAARKTGSGIMGLKIAKNSFVFTSRKRFKYLREFKPQKKLEGIDLVRKLVASGLQTIRQPGSQPKSRAAASAEASQKITLPSYFYKGLLIAGGLLVLFFAALAIWFLSLASSPSILPQVQPAAPSFALSPVYSAIVPYGLENMSIALASFKSEASGMRELNATISAYPSPVPSRVVLVRAGRQQPKAMADFEAAFSSLLRQDNTPPERLHIDQLRHAPPGFAIYILASDYMPASLMGAAPGKDIVSITKNGSILVFTGFKPTTVLPEAGGTQDLNPTEIGAKYGMSFSDFPQADFAGLSARNPLYSVSGPDVRITNGQVFSVGFSKMNSTGKLVLVPQTIEQGWGSDGGSAAKDIYSLVRHVVWMAPISTGTLYAGPGALNGTLSATSKPSSSVSAASYPYLLVSATSVSNETTLRSLQLLAKSEATKGGQLLHEPYALPTAVSGKPLLMRGEGLSPVSVDLLVQAFKDGVKVDEVDAGSHRSFFQYDYDVHLAPGDYVMKLVDTSGNLYATSYLHVPLLTVESESSNWDAGIFRFHLLSDGSVAEGQMNLSGISVRIDNEQPSRVPVRAGIMIYNTTAVPVPPGAHNFTFDFGPNAYVRSSTFTPSRNFWDETQYRLALLGVAVIFIIGYVLQRPDKEMYGLDVPDFPPLSKISIPVKRQVLLGIFDSVNRDYKWKFMPLSIAEIKSGFGKLSFKGKGILIGDYNEERLLDQLVQEGYVKRSQDLYLPSAWEAQSGRSAHYLALFRRMRDVFVNNAVMFSELNSSSDYDSLANFGNGTAFHIYADSPDLLGKLVRGAGKYRQVVLFANDGERDAFERSLDSTSKLRIMAKELLAAEKAFLVSVEHLRDFLKSRPYG